MYDFLYRSSIETIALNCLVFEKIAFFCNLATDRQTNKQTNRWMHEAASGGTSAKAIKIQFITYPVTLLDAGSK